METKITRFDSGITESEINQLSPLVLAYVGDAVYELAVRTALIADRSRKVNDLHREAVDMVKAESQAAILRNIEPQLTETEMTWVKRGRNAKGRYPRSAVVADYRLSTGLEALLGYLYLIGNETRLTEILRWITSPAEDAKP